MDINKCLDAALEQYLKELRYIEDMVKQGEVGEDEIETMRKVVYGFYEVEVENCYQTYEGRSTPGRKK